MFIAVLVGILIVSLYLLNQRWFSYWESRGFKQLHPKVLVGSAGPILSGKLSMGEFYRDVYNQFKDHKIVGVYFFYRPLLVITDPVLLQHVMVKDFKSFHDRPMPCDEVKDPLSANIFSLPGQKWRDLRVKLTPVFTSGKLKGMFSTIRQSGQVLEDYLGKILSNGVEDFDLRDLMARFSTNIISSVAFGIENDCINDPDHIFRKMGERLLEPNFKNAIKGLVSFLAPQLFHKLNLKFTDPEVEAFIYSVVKQTVDYREENNLTRNDFMQLMIQLKNQGFVSTDKEENGAEETTKTVTEFTIDQLTAQALVFYIGGFETSSSTLCFVFYELAKNRNIQQKVQEEIDRVFKAAGPDGITYEMLGELKYLECCIDEALRKYPIVPVHLRQATSDYKIPNSNLVIPNGTSVMIPALGFHRDPRIYDDPMEYKPERFLNSSHGGGKANGVFYTPFGSGPRNCIGMRMGKLTVQIAVALILSKFNLELSDKSMVHKELEFHPNQFNLTPLKPFKTKLSAR